MNQVSIFKMIMFLIFRNFLLLINFMTFNFIIIYNILIYIIFNYIYLHNY